MKPIYEVDKAQIEAAMNASLSDIKAEAKTGDEEQKWSQALFNFKSN